MTTMEAAPMSNLPVGLLRIAENVVILYLPWQSFSFKEALTIQGYR